MVHGDGLGVSGTADLSRPSEGIGRYRKRRGGGWETPNTTLMEAQASLVGKGDSVEARSVSDVASKQRAGQAPLALFP